MEDSALASLRIELETARQTISQLESAAKEVHQIRESLRESETLYRTAFEYTGTAMMVIDENTTLIMGNNRLEDIAGYTNDEVTKKRKWTEFVVPEDIPRLVAYHSERRINPNDVPDEYEFRILDRNQAVHDVLANVNMIPGTKKSLVSLVDITKRKITEMALRDSEQRFKEIAELLPGIICEMDMTYRLTYVNEMGLKTFGFTREDFEKGIYITDLIPLEFRDKLTNDISNIHKGDYGNAQAYKVFKKDKTFLDILVNSNLICKNGTVTGLRTCIIDITDRIKAETELKESEERFRSIYSSSPIGIALYNLEGSSIDMNDSFKSMFGVDTVISTASLYSLLSINEEQKSGFLKGQTYRTETEIVSPKDKFSTQYFEWAITPLSMTPLGPSSILAQVQEITERKVLQEERLQRERDATAKAEAMIVGLRKQLVNTSSFHNMVSRSAQMKQIFELLPEIANASATVLVTGESGTGKELIARSLHELSLRKSKPFIAINCSALPDTLLESELFGYKAGAFTDAKRDKPGKFALAENGTIFLDEIGDISPAMQVKLLRVLQEKVYDPLGGTSPLKANVRILAATNKDLITMVNSGDFREDLYYRINVVSVKLPSLRERRCDIPLLCDHFVELFNSRYGKSITGICTEALDMLVAHDFPGNIRELENIIEHAFIFCKGSLVQMSHLPAQMRNSEKEELKSLAAVTSFDELERMYIKSILNESGGSRIKAAQRLGIHKATLFRKIKQLGIQ